MAPDSSPVSTAHDPERAAELAATYGILQYTADGSMTHCPLMVSPAPVSDALLDQLASLTEPFGRLMNAVAGDLEFMSETLRRAATADEYTRFLLELALEHERDASSWRFAITRSDYFATADGDGLRQVELNTIAASYLGLAGRIADFHRAYRTVVAADWDVVENRPVDGVADAFAEVVREYGAVNGCVLLISQAGERNIFDQRILEAALAERGLRVVRSPLEALLDRARITSSGDLVIDDQVAAVTYFRAGYRPDDLATQAARDARRLLARSSSIAVPDLRTHLSGTKKIQQVLTQPDILARFLSPDDAAQVTTSFALLAGLDDPIPFEGRTVPAFEAAIERPERFVLKPQREGGGFNFYGEAIKRALLGMNASERDAFVLMERLHPAARVADGLRAGQSWRGSVVSELGHFGVLFARGDDIRLNRGVGYLVRTKAADQDEGGISSGAGHLDSLARLPAS